MSRNGMNIYQLLEFNDRLQSQSTQDAFMIKTIREIATKLLEDLKRNTPVDTGALRDSYKIQSVVKTSNGYEINISNKVRVQRGKRAGQASYASWVEEGHRLVIGGEELSYIEGRFFMRNTMNEFEQRKLNGILKTKLTEWFERCAK